MDDAQPTFRAMKRTAKTIAIGAVLVAGGSVGGCVNISAPDKPIEINLNIRVTQEVIYRLEDSTKALIQKNPDIF